MAPEKIGQVKSGKSRKQFEVEWDAVSGDVFVAYAGGKHCAKASSAAEAMRKAEAFLYDK